MKFARVCVMSLGCVGGAVAFGFVANAAIDLMMPAPDVAALAQAKTTEAPASGGFALASASSVSVPAPAPAAKAAASFALASASSTQVPAEIAPVKVKTIPMLYREDARVEETAPAARESATREAAPAVAAVPLPRKRPASAPVMAMAHDGENGTGSIARQPATMAIAAATRKLNAEDGDPLSAAGLERMKMALALTAEQEEYWPAIASELRALGKTLKTTKSPSGKISVDQDTMQRLYWAAAPLITRLSYEQKARVKQMAHVMGLHQVAEAL